MLNNSSSLTVDFSGYSGGFSGGISGNGSLIKGGGGSWMLYGNNTYLGNTTVSGSGGILETDSAGALPGGSTVIVDSGATLRLGYNPADVPAAFAAVVNGTLDLNGRNVALSNLQGSGTIDDADPATTSTLTIGSGDATSTFTGAIKNSAAAAHVAVAKIGAGSLTLSGANTYSAGTSVSAGLLCFSYGALPGSGSIDILAGGALEATGPYSTAAAWLASNRIDQTSAGALALAADEPAISLGNYTQLSLAHRAASPSAAALRQRTTSSASAGGRVI